MPYLVLTDDKGAVKAYVVSSDDGNSDKWKLVDFLIEEQGWSTMEVSSKPRTKAKRVGKQ